MTLPTTVVRLRIWCDVDQADGSIDPERVFSFRVCEFAELSDGREVVLIADRGWSGTLPLSRHTSVEIERDVYTVLLPDWADVHNPLPPDLAAVEDNGGAQDWELLSQRLGGFGIAATVETLMRVPRRLDLSPRLRAHAGDHDE